MEKIYIIEDDAGIVNSLSMYLENSEYKVCFQNTWDNAVANILANKSDIVILDINLPIKNGIDICRELRTKSDIPVIMLTARAGEFDKVLGLEIWADDYISKPFSPRELLARIKNILRRYNNNKEEKIEKLRYKNIELDLEKMILKIWWKSVTMTKLEFDILAKIFEEWGKVVSRETLMKDIIGYNEYAFDRTIDTHIKNLRKKLWIKDIILTVRGEGYRLNK